MWTARPFCAAVSRASVSTWLSKNDLFSIALVMRVNSWSTMRPEPIFMWPVSELPICLAGNPTSMPDAFSRVRG